MLLENLEASGAHRSIAPGLPAINGCAVQQVSTRGPANSSLRWQLACSMRLGVPRMHRLVLQTTHDNGSIDDVALIVSTGALER